MGYPLQYSWASLGAPACSAGDLGFLFFFFLPLYAISMAVLGFSRSRASKISIYICIHHVNICIYVHTYIHICTFSERENYYAKLAHAAMMEAEKPLSLPSASWRPRKADSGIQS